MAILTVELLEPAADLEVFLDQALTLRGRYTETPGTPQPVSMAGAVIKASGLGLSFSARDGAAPNTMYDFAVPVASLGVGIHQLYLYASATPQQVESNRIYVRVRFRHSEGQFVVFRETSGYKEFLNDAGGWTQRESEARKWGTETGAIIEASAHAGALAAPKHRVFRGPLVA